MRTICNTQFPPFLQASIPGPARHRGSFLGSSTDRGAAPAFTHTKHKSKIKSTLKSPRITPYGCKSISPFSHKTRSKFGFIFNGYIFLSQVFELFPLKCTCEATLELKLSRKNFAVQLEISRAYFSKVNVLSSRNSGNKMEL